MPGIIDTTRDKQTRIKVILQAAHARIDRLLLKISGLPLQAQTTLLNILNKQREQLRAIQHELDKIDLTKPGVNTFNAVKETSKIIKNLTQSKDSLDKIENTIKKLLTSSSTASVQRSENKEPNRTTPPPSRYATPSDYKELSNEEMQDLFNEENKPSQQTTAQSSSITEVQAINWPTVPKTAVSSTSIAPPPQAKNLQTRQFTSITPTQYTRSTSDYQKNQALLNQGEKLLKSKEPGITKRYKSEMRTMNKTLDNSDRALERVDAASKAFGVKDTHSDEADALIQEELNRQRPKAPGR
jgi:hypothetical protein